MRGSWCNRSLKALLPALVVGAGLVAAVPAVAFEVQCGPEGGDAFGWSVAVGGDYDGDSVPDIAVGAPCAWVGTFLRAGRVRVFSGSTGALLLSLAGSSEEQEFGAALDWIPDLDGDGRAELAIGSATFAAPKPTGGATLGAGKVEVLSSKGGVLWTVSGTTANASFGETLATLPDLNGDGKAEVVVGASGAKVSGLVRGAGFLLSGANGAQLAQTGGENEGDLWASLVGPAGDMNGDGVVDWFAASKVSDAAPPELVGAALVTTTTVTTTTTTTLPPRAGRLSVFSGKAPYGPLQTYKGQSLVQRLGRAAAPAGDRDGDGLGDLWIGSPGDEPTMLEDAGSIALFSAAGPIIRELTEPVPQQLAAFGTSLVVPGSLDGGNVDDVVAGAPLGKVSGKVEAGRVHAFAGEDGSLLWTQSGTLALERFGQSLSSGLDFDHDGVPDLVVGAPGDAPAGKRGAGSAFVVSGKNGDILASFPGRRGRETRIFVAGPDLGREPVVRSFDPYGRRREAEILPFRAQRTTSLSMAVLNGGRRADTENGAKTLLAIGTGQGAATPEVAVYRAGRRRQRVSQFTAGPVGYTGGLNVAGGDFTLDVGEEMAIAPADANGNAVVVGIHRAQFTDPFGRITWTKVRDFTAFSPTDKVGGTLVNAAGAYMAAADLTPNDQDELVVAPASGLPVVRLFSHTGTQISEWLAYPPEGDGVHPNSGVSVAVGDLDGERGPEIVTVPASGQPWVRAWHADGTPWEFAPAEPVSFFVTQYGLLFNAGLHVTTADVDLDGQSEIIVTPARPSRGATPQILAFEPDGSLVKGWVPYQPFGPLDGGGGLTLCGLDQYWKP